MSLTYRTGRMKSGAHVTGTHVIGFKSCLALAAFLSFVATSSHACTGWLTNYEEALAAAQETGRPILTVFTGSDWCHHCRTLERTVLESKEFRTWAHDRVILLMVDLPKEGISVEERKTRSRICVKYGVRSFPNAVLIAPDGAPLATQPGYQGEKTTAWLASFDGHAPLHLASHASTSKPKVHASLVTAVESAKDTRKPILVMVSRPGDESSTTRLSSLLDDPEFESLANEHFVVARVPRSTVDEGTEEDDAAVAELLGDDDVPPSSVRLVVTDDGCTPLFRESCTHETRHVVVGLRRFLAGRHGTMGRR